MGGEDEGIFSRGKDRLRWDGMGQGMMGGQCYQGVYTRGDSSAGVTLTWP